MRDDVRQLVLDLLRDREEVVDGPQVELAIDEAVIRYSQDRPRRVVEDLVADGTLFLALPTAWVDDLSTISQFEHPVDHVPQLLWSVDAVEVELGPSGLRVRLPQAIESGETVRISHSTTHVLTDVSDTVGPVNRLAVAYWAAAFIAEQLASHYATESSAMIAADTTQVESKRRAFAQIAKDMRSAYYSKLNIKPGRQQPASVDVDLDSRDALGGRRLFHPYRGRR